MPEAAALQPITGFADPLSSLSHLAGAFAFAALSLSLLQRGKLAGVEAASLTVFAFSCVLLLSVSGAYHFASHGGAARHVLQRLDHAAIFILIAGSFTPVHAMLFRGRWRWGMLAAVWTMAIAGLTLKTVYFASMPESLGLLLYLGFGWFGLVSGIALARRFGFRFIRPMLWSALAYTFGALVDFLHWPALAPGIVGAHELFHLAVLIGISFHWKFVLGLATRRTPGGNNGTFVDSLIPVHSTISTGV